MTARVLKPCPWCARTPEISPWHGGKPSKRAVCCVYERCKVSPMVTGDTEELAVVEWNCRAPIMDRAKAAAIEIIDGHFGFDYDSPADREREIEALSEIIQAASRVKVRP